MSWAQTSTHDQPNHGGFPIEEQERLRSHLSKGLGPEWLSQRSGPGGRLTYIEGKTAINLANELFGFNGWSSEIQNCTVDFVDVADNGRVNLGISTTVRITLKDGTFHEDVGYGSAENSRNKAAAFEKAKKEAATDAMKRALRMFGNALGNCIYDKTFLGGISRMANPTIKFAPDNLYRHHQFAQPPAEAKPVSTYPNSKLDLMTPPPALSVAKTQHPPQQPTPQPVCVEEKKPLFVSEDSFTFDDDIEDTALIEMAEVHDKVDLELPIEPIAVKQDPDVVILQSDVIPVSNQIPTNGHTCRQSIPFLTESVSMPDHTTKRQRQ